MYEKNLIMENSLKKIQNPVILEFGVNRGHSSKRFLEHITNFGGDIFSIDINDCSKVISSNKWNFFQCNDLDIDKIVERFPKLKQGIDFLYIDSYHDPSHVKTLLDRWFIYIKKNGFIYLDDIESYLYRIRKKTLLSILDDGINKEIINFYHSNYDQLICNMYFKGSGLAELVKLSEMGTKADTKKIWSYNIFFAGIYLFLKKLKFKYFKN